MTETVSRFAGLGLLTPREAEVLHRLANGQKWNVVMAEMGIARETVASYRKAIIRKLAPGGNLYDALRAVGWLVVPD